MKILNLSIVPLALFCAGASHAASSIQLEVGEFKDASNATVMTGTWALILNTGTSGTLPGGITVGATQDSLTNADSSQIATDFSGITLELGALIGGDTIVGIGSIGDEDLGDGWVTALVNFADGQEDLAYGIYWFPGLVENDTVSGAFEVGGLFDPTTSLFAPRGMESPTAPIAGESAVFNIGSTAVAVPEPSALALSVLGLAALLRRRRK